MGRVHPWLWNRTAPSSTLVLCRSTGRYAQGTSPGHLPPWRCRQEASSRTMAQDGMKGSSIPQPQPQTEPGGVWPGKAGVDGWIDEWGEAYGGAGPGRGCFPRTITAGTWEPTPLRQAPPRPAPARPSVCRGVALVAGLRELDSLSPQALREAQEAEDCERSGLARRVGSEVSAASRGGSSAGCSRWDRRPHLSAFLKCCWVLTSGGEMDPTEPQTPKTQTREARSRLWKGRGPGGRCQEEFLCAALFPGIQSLLLE